MAIDIVNYKRKASSKNNNDILDFLKKDFTFSVGISDKKKEAFYLELSILLNAGIDIKSALEIIVSEQKNKNDKQLFFGIKEVVINGETLSEAIKATGKFSEYEYYTIQIGEETGKIYEVLKELSLYFQKRIKQKRQLINALSYPVIVLLTSFGAIALMMNTVVPLFSGIYKRTNSELPWLTSVVISFSELLGSYFYFILLLSISVGYYFYSQRKKTWYRDYFSHLALKIPVIGDMIRKVYLAQFCSSMKLLLGSKIPLIRALALSKQTIGFYPIEISLDLIEKNIMRGASLNKSMEMFPVYEHRMITFIKIGEEVNKLEEFFEKIANQYNEEIDHSSSVIKNIMEPLIILFLGGVIAIILVAMYLPLFNLSSVY